MRPPRVAPYDGEPRFALLCVNFSTTHYVKLLLLTLGEQEDLEPVRRVVIVDNGSRDGGVPFLRQLGAQVPCLDVLERRHRLHHAVGMRAAVRALDRLDGDDPKAANYLIFCDSDVILREPALIGTLAGTALLHEPALIGEVRTGVNPQPDIQASFFVVRRDVHARRDIAPLAHHGSPAYALQRSIWDAGLPVVDLPLNRAGHLLHRGRAGVSAASLHHRSHAYASVANRAPHFMGVPDGEAIWRAVEERWSALLDPDAEPQLLVHLASRLSRLGVGTGAS